MTQAQDYSHVTLRPPVIEVLYFGHVMTPEQVQFAEEGHLLLSKAVRIFKYLDVAF